MAQPAFRGRKAVIITVVATAVAGLLLSLAGYGVYSRFIREDSGVEACKALRDGRVPGGVDEADEKDTWTEADYRQVRKEFEDSRHDDIRNHGTALIDVTWQIEQLDEGDHRARLALLGPMITHATGLRTACANQDVIVKL